MRSVVVRQLRHAHIARTAIRLRFQSSTASAPLPPKPQTRSRTRRVFGYITLSLLLGGGLGTLVVHTIAPPPHPEPGSSGDKLLLSDLNDRIDSEFKVKVLRGKCTAAARGLRGDEGLWVELPSSLTTAPLNTTNSTSKEAIEAGKSSTFTHGSMAGARGLGVSRSFWNKQESELVSVIWFGGALSGWPGVTHGGAIATVLEEQSTKAAALLSSLSTGGPTGENTAAQVELTYKKPTHANGFYLIRTVPRAVGTEGLTALVGSKREEIEVEGRLETMEGITCVEYRAVVPAHGTPAAGARSVKDSEVVSPKGGWFG